jgi:hypothetical protein
VRPGEAFEIQHDQPFGFKTQLNLIADGNVLEYIYVENEKDRAHIARP